MEHQPKPADLEALQSYFGHSSFRPQQWNIIRSIIEDSKNNLVIMPTGYGKSLLYQYSAVRLGGLTLVISPLISLMEDQVRYLNEKNIKACFLGSAQDDDLTADISQGNYRLVYITPEHLRSDEGESLLKNAELKLIAIDEANCMSEWGNGFRPSYLIMSEIIKNKHMQEHIEKVPILAVTAAATPSVRNDMESKLGLRNVKIWCTEFERPNLDFRVRMKSFGMWHDVQEHIAQHKHQRTIIQCITKKDANRMASTLTDHGYQCEAYHSSVHKEARRDVQKRFTENSLKIVACTVAFGMGLDIPDVRLVIHYGPPMEFETYYLQVGQAGRDGNHSKCVMFWHEADFDMHRFIRENTSKEALENHEKESNKMRSYLNTKGCRRNFILRYFGKTCCDNCEFIPEASSSQTDVENSKDQNKRFSTSSEEHIQVPVKRPKVEHRIVFNGLTRVTIEFEP